MFRGLIALLTLAAAVLPASARGEGTAGETAQQAPQSAADIQRKLQARAEFEYEAVPLLEFVKRVSAKSELPMRVDEQAIRQAGLSLDVHVSASHPAVTVRAALSTTLRKYGLHYRIDEGQLVIGPAPRVPDEALLRQRREDDEELSRLPPRKPSVELPPIRLQMVVVQRLGAVAPAEPRLRIGATALDEWLFDKPRSPDDARSHLEEKLQERIAAIDRSCGLTELQRRKLQLAASGDIRRLLEQVDELRQRFEPMKLRLDMNEVITLHDEALRLREPLAAGPFDERSLFAKVLATTLTPEQAAAYRRSRARPASVSGE